MPDDFSRFLPLAPASLHILLALSGEDLHGYGILQQVARQSGGQYKLGPGTLYDNLQRLLTKGLVQEAGSRSGAAESRRRYYRLTAMGRRVISAEIVRLERVIRGAKEHLLPAKPRSA